MWEFGLLLGNPTTEPMRVTQTAVLSGMLSPGEWRTLHFTSAWGAEFEPVRGDLGSGLQLVGRAGRSSHGLHPLMALECSAGALIVTVAWSGNWRIDVDPAGRLTAGMDDDGFVADLAPGATLSLPPVLVAVGGDIDEAGAHLAGAVGSELVPRTAWSERLPSEWNSWWPYEDAGIDERTFLAESRTAARLGLDVATLDAGWFGRPEAGSDWQAERGDWSQVNTARFPRGLPALAGDVRESGAAFGIWLEGEAVGASARLRAERPELLASRAGGHDGPNITVSLDRDDPSFLGYVCLGSPDARDFLSGALDDAVSSTGARWLKLDFNVDPGAGCDRTDHGHGAGDGLFRHYEGLYAVLDDFRERHPEVILEACSSGGLRLDLGLARHVHCSFLSDPDWTEHHLQVLWGASLMFPPVAMLHWSWSQWRGDHPQQRLDWVSLDEARFDTMLRAAMLHRFGVSLKLTELPARLAERLAVHTNLYRLRLAPLVRAGVLRRLTDPPLRGGRGERVPAFQLDAGDAHLYAAFALDEGAAAPTARFRGLDPARHYRVEDLTAGAGTRAMPGIQLMREGLPTSSTASSWLLLATAEEV
ncbi:MAG: glycoside hydrolase clan [Naasia sp.]|nr:glycoside hydrolase clan [Naasia sp.]